MFLMEVGRTSPISLPWAYDRTASQNDGVTSFMLSGWPRGSELKLRWRTPSVAHESVELG